MAEGITMTEEQKILLFVAIAILVIVIVLRNPTILTSLMRKATARCRDGSMSFSGHRCGTCSYHGGVAEFLTAGGA